MGWLFNARWETKRDLLAELTRNEPHRTCLASCVRGTTLWSVWEIVNGDLVSRYIGCDLLQKGSSGQGWGYKDMDESCGPYYYSCPLKYFDMVPQVSNQEWRDKVIHRANLKKLEVKPGIIYGLVDGFIYKYLKVTSVYEFDKNNFCAVDRNGKQLRVSRAHLSGATFETWPDDS